MGHGVRRHNDTALTTTTCLSLGLLRPCDLAHVRMYRERPGAYTFMDW